MLRNILHGDSPLIFLAGILTGIIIISIIWFAFRVNNAIRKWEE